MNERRYSLILGAGASRSVSYAKKRPLPSFLDNDFFELLQKLEAQRKDKSAVTELIEYVLKLSSEATWLSMERTFYTLHNRLQMSELLFGNKSQLPSVAHFLDRFTVAVDALLRAAHGQESCSFHINFLERMSSCDAIITFNYDLVTERSLKKLPSPPAFGPWLYEFQSRPERTERIPTVYKLHGSVNWSREKQYDGFRVRQESWDDFDDEPGYRAHRTEQSISNAETVFSILLPYWDKKVDEKPWSSIWTKTAAHLMGTRRLIIWGYSLPLTDLKALELFRLSLLSTEPMLEDICVIDPSRDVRLRWRSMFLRQKFWPYDSVLEFLKRPPDWW